MLVVRNAVRNVLSPLSSDIDERVTPLLVSASNLRGPSASVVLRSLAYRVL